MHGVTVGEKLHPVGVFIALGVTPLIPRSFSIEARPMFTENVEHEFRRERSWRGVAGALRIREWRKSILRACLLNKLE